MHVVGEKHNSCQQDYSILLFFSSTYLLTNSIKSSIIFLRRSFVYQSEVVLVVWVLNC